MAASSIPQAAGEVYFDSVTMFVFFLLGGRFLEMTARQKAVSVTEALAQEFRKAGGKDHSL